MHRTTILAVGFLLLTAGCSHRPTAPEGFHLISQIDRAPVLSQCHGYVAPEMGTGIPVVGIPVRFGVTAEGRVINTTAQAPRWLQERVPSEVVASYLSAAELAASTCEYLPGTLAGQPVAVHDFGMMIMLPFRS